MRRTLTGAGLLALLACGDTTAPEGAGELGAWIQVDGRRRTYSLFVPSSADPATPAPLVVALHSFGGTGRGFVALTGLDAPAQRLGFIVAYPDGIGEAWAYGCDCTPVDELGIDDVAFLAALTDQLADSLSIDRARVYLTGFSQGGFLALHAACTRPGTFTGVAAVGATLLASEAGTCASGPPLPLLYILGTDDELVPYDGRASGAALLSADSATALWAGRNGCAGPPTLEAVPDTATTDDSTVDRRTYAVCAGGSEVVLYTVNGGGHTWPGSLQRTQPFLGTINRDIVASEIIVAFFARH